jgi:hypothetical protein
MKVYRVSTTAYEEEDFFLHTEITEQEIIDVVTPIVMRERDGYEDYDNELLLDALRKKYSRKAIELYTEFDTIKI